MECTQVCGKCLNGEQCDHVNGSCANGCDKGTHGDKCNKGLWNVKANCLRFFLYILDYLHCKV